MAILQPKQSSGMDLKDIAQLLGAVGPMFGSGKQVQTTSGDAGTNAMSQQLLSSILGGVDPAAMDGVINSIFQKGKAAFGPQLFQGAGGGAYSSTVQQQLANEALARATAEAGGARLSATQDAQRTAASLVNSMQGANRRTVTQTGASPLGKAGGLALAALQGRSALGKTLGGKKGLGIEEIDKIVNSGLGTGSDFTGQIGDPLQGLFGGGGAVSADVGTMFDPVTLAGDSNFYGPLSSVFSGLESGAGLLGDFGGVASALTDFGTSAFADAGLEALGFDFGLGSDAAGFGLNFGFPGAGTLLNAGLDLLQGKDPFQSIGNTFETVTSWVGDFFDSIFDLF